MLKVPLQQSWPMPTLPRPIVIFGAGSIVKDAHIPAYQAMGFPIAGVYDIDIAKAKSIGHYFDIPVFTTLEGAVSQSDAIFDLATPPSSHHRVLNALPEGSFVLIQKPMGSTLEGATSILKLCESRDLQACVNFQLRFAPVMLALKDLCNKGLLGEIVDIDMWAA